MLYRIIRLCLIFITFGVRIFNIKSHRMRIRLLLLACLITMGVTAQKNQPLKEIYAAPPVVVSSPLMTDTVDVKGKKLNDENILKMKLAIPEQVKFNNTLLADSAGYFFVEKPEKNAQFHLFSFYVGTNRFAKGTLKVTSPNMFEIYVDDKSVVSKTTKEDNLKTAKNKTTALTAYPKACRMVIKLLVSAKDSVVPCLKVDIEKLRDDSSTLFCTTNSDLRKFDFTDIMLGKRLTNVRISPNGKYGLLSYRETFGEKSVISTELYNIRTGKSILVGGDKPQLNWMPASEKLYYVQTFDEVSNLVTIDPATLEETTVARNVPKENLYISPDEKTLYYYVEEKGDEPKGDLKLLLSPNDRQPSYRNERFIYSYKLSTGLSQQLTFGSSTTSLNDISPDSKKILFTTTEETLTERPFRKYSMFLFNLESMSVDTLWTDEGFAYGATFSPEGKEILISGAPEAFGGIGLNINKDQIANSYDGQAFIMDLETKKIEAITKNFAPSVNSAVWNKSDNMIYLKVTDKDYVNIYRYDPKNKKYTLIPVKEEVVRAFNMAEKAPIAIYSGASTANTTRAYSLNINNLESVLISDPDKEHQDKLVYGEAQDWNFKNSDGVTIYGRCFTPPNFDEAKKYPMIVYYYGGTTPTSRSYEHNYPPNVYAALGYVVYVVQPSGAIGFGQKFSSMHVNAWGKRTAEDIIEGTERFVKEHPFVDGEKIGCIGASYGGFMTMYLQTRTDIFAAAVSHAGISSISSYWGEGYWGFTYSSGASAHSYPWNNPDMYVKQSPLFSADKVKTPILLLHGTEDTNVPPGESIQFYTALKILGKPVEFIEVKGENHVIADYKHRVEWMHSVLAWFDRWLKDDAGWWKEMYPNSPTLKQ